MQRNANWQRIVLLTVLAYEGLGSLAGGILLILAPDGRLMDMPVAMMNGVFSDFMIPGIILLGLGIINCIAFWVVFRKSSLDWIWGSIAMFGLLIWFYLEIIILQELHWLHAMWGLPVVIGALLVLPLYPLPQETLRKSLLFCGILSSIHYIAINILIPPLWPEYNQVTQTVSELSAVDAPTRMLWMIASAPYTLLMIAFGPGVILSAHQNKKIRIAGWLLFSYGLLCLFWPFAPMHLRETLAAGGSTISDTLHILLASITQLVYFLALFLTAKALDKSFRIYSILTFIVLLIFGALTFIEAPNVALNAPTPFIGLWERINIGVFLAWICVLATKLWSGVPSVSVKTVRK